MNGQKHYGYMGKTLRVNLTSGEVKTVEYNDQFRKWLGGSGLAVKILYEELPDWVTPFDPRNLLIFSSGALMGTLAPGACKMNISTLGPMTGGWATGSSDSYVGMELKHAGYDSVIVEGRAHKPVYLYITDQGVELRDAAHLWGKDTWETLDILRGELEDPRLHIISIGPAGENLVRGACVIQDRGRAFGRCGTGAVMGSKNLKAVICKGSRAIEVAQPQRFIEKVNECRMRMKACSTYDAMNKYGTLSALNNKQKICGIPYRNFQDSRLPDELAEKINPLQLIDKYQVAPSSFPGCVLCCGRHVTVTEGPYKGLTTEMNQWEVMGAIMGKLGIETREFMLAINAYCNRMGVDVDLVGGVLGWAMECFERGILTKDDLDGLELHWGDEAAVFELTRKLCYRQGCGNLLAEGCARAAELTGRGSEYYAMHIKKQDLYELLKSSNGWCLGTATSTRGGGHTTGAPNCEQNGMEMDNEMSMKLLGMPSKLAQDPETFEGKPQIVYYFEILSRMCNTLGVCYHNSAWYDISFVNVADLAELVSAATGEEFTEDDLKEIAMRQLNMEKAFNLRFTNFARKDDMPTQRDMKEPVASGSRKGWKIDEDKYNAMLDEYYDLHGWERETSYPTRKTLEWYGLAEAARDLERIGKLGK